MAKVAASTGDDGVDVAFEAVGTPATFTRRIALAGFAGRVVHVGYSEAPVTHETKAFDLEELDIPGSRDATAEHVQAVIAHSEQRGAEAGALITRVVPLQDAATASPFRGGSRDALETVVAR